MTEREKNTGTKFEIMAWQNGYQIAVRTNGVTDMRPFKKQFYSKIGRAVEAITDKFPDTQAKDIIFPN